MHFRKASDKVSITKLTKPFNIIEENQALLTTVNELLDARSIFPFRIESIKGTSKPEAVMTAITAAFPALVSAVQKLFLNKLPIGYDRFAELIAIWGVIAGIFTTGKSLPRAFFTNTNRKFKDLLSQPLTIEVYRLDINGNPTTRSTHVIGTLEDFLNKKDDLIYETLTNKSYKNISSLRIEFDDNSGKILNEAYRLAKKIDLGVTIGAATTGIIAGGPLASDISAKMRGEPTDPLFGDKKQAKDFPTKPSSIISNPSFTQDQLRGKRRL